MIQQVPRAIPRPEILVMRYDQFVDIVKDVRYAEIGAEVPITPPPCSQFHN